MCTYDEVCPGGKGKLPVGGKQSNGDMWSAAGFNFEPKTLFGRGQPNFPTQGARELSPDFVCAPRSPVRTVDGKPEWVQTGSRSGGTCNPLSTYHGSTGSACGWCNNNANYGHKAVYACCPCPKGKTCKKHIVKWYVATLTQHPLYAVASHTAAQLPLHVMLGEEHQFGRSFQCSSRNILCDRRVC